jgi:hypothetical protein
MFNNATYLSVLIASGLFGLQYQAFMFQRTRINFRNSQKLHIGLMLYLKNVFLYRVALVTTH